VSCVTVSSTIQFREKVKKKKKVLQSTTGGKTKSPTTNILKERRAVEWMYTKKSNERKDSELLTDLNS
jgi:threonine synthase